jgi:hypothetical protein
MIVSVILAAQNSTHESSKISGTYYETALDENFQRVVFVRYEDAFVEAERKNAAARVRRLQQ